MSIAEQDQILGRLMRESRESRRQIAALNAKLQGYRSRFHEVSKAFSGFEGPGALERAASATQQLPEPSAVLDTLEELRIEQEHHREIDSQLAGF